GSGELGQGRAGRDGHTGEVVVELRCEVEVFAGIVVVERAGRQLLTCPIEGCEEDPVGAGDVVHVHGGDGCVLDEVGQLESGVCPQAGFETGHEPAGLLETPEVVSSRVNAVLRHGEVPSFVRMVVMVSPVARHCTWWYGSP